MSEKEQPPSAVYRADGVTASERYLKLLCERTFLSLWSYPGVYRDQGGGKEVTDLLVVFEENIIIFSDKDWAFPNRGTLEMDWSRWFRRAIMKSARQVWGAERWIRAYPKRLFLDSACSQPFPIELPNPAEAKFHRIVVAHDSTRQCKKTVGGSGSLMIAPMVVGALHYDPTCGGVTPFTVGQIDPTKGFVHVLDDTSLEIVLGTLDTVVHP